MTKPKTVELNEPFIKHRKEELRFTSCIREGKPKSGTYLIHQDL